MNLGVNEFLAAMAGVGTLAGMLLHIRAKNSKVALEVARDAAEKAEAESMTGELKRLRLQATADAGTIARLNAENRSLASDLTRLEHDFARVMDLLPVQVARAVKRTNFGEYED